MNRQSAVELREQILSDVGRASLVQGTELQAVARQPPTDQLAIGYSCPPGLNADYGLELRVQRTEGNAFAVAREYREKFEKEVRLQVVQRVDLLPYLSALRRPDPGAKLSKRKLADRRVLKLGLSVSRLDTDAGTLGAFVRMNGQDGHFVLSCNHVLAKLNAGKTGDFIYHPGKPDQKPLGSRYRVAKYDQCIDLMTDDLNQSDAALAQVNEDVDHTGTVVPPGYADSGRALSVFAGDPLEDIRRGQAVCKIGRTSGLTTGTVTAVGLGPLPVYTGLGKMLFEEIVEVVGDDDKPFSQAGDSGSLVFLPESFQAIGLVFAGGPVKREDGTTVIVSYACTLPAILEYFEAELV